MNSSLLSHLLEVHVLYLDHGPVEITNVYSRRLETGSSGQPGSHGQESKGRRNVGSGSTGGKRRQHPGRYGEGSIIGVARDAGKLGANLRGGILGTTNYGHRSGTAPGYCQILRTGDIANGILTGPGGATARDGESGVEGLDIGPTGAVIHRIASRRQIFRGPQRGERRTPASRRTGRIPSGP